MDGDPLDAFFDDLRRPATGSELTGESDAVASIATAVFSTKGTSMHLPSPSRLNPRRLRVASFVAAGVIGFGGAAAAGPGVFDAVTGGDEPELVVQGPDVTVAETDAPETTEPDSAVASTTTDPVEPDDAVLADGEDAGDSAGGDVAGIAGEGDATPAPPVDDPDTAFDETKCAEGNHGKTVSSIAHETPSGPGKGAIVSEAAKSSCGKDKADKADKADKQDEEDESDDESDDKPDKADKADKQKSSTGHGKGHGKGHDKGHGNGHRKHGD